MPRGKTMQKKAPAAREGAKVRKTAKEDEESRKHAEEGIKQAAPMTAPPAEVLSGVRNDAPEERVFILANGRRLKNIKELADVMAEIEDHVFHHHVTESKNDFATWLHDVFDEVDLAKELAGCTDKGKVQLSLYRHIAHNLWQEKK